MNPIGWLQLALYLVILLLLVKPLGAYMARVYSGERTFLHPILAPVERVFYRAAGVNPEAEMGWQVYALAVLAFNLLGLVAVYVLQRAQGFLPLNPQGFGAVSPDSSFNTAVELRHQHQLAGLRRRIHDELRDADACVDGPELRLGRHGHGRAGRAGARVHAPLCPDHRQLLG